MRRRQLGIGLVVAGGLLLSYVGSRYTIGAVRADWARQAWDAASARSAVAAARSFASYRGGASVAEGAPVARIIIPRIGLDEIVLEGVNADDLNAEPGHMPGSAIPGEPGNAVISAHRDRHFNHLDELSVGDSITTESGPAGQRRTWMVVSTRVIDKNAPALFRTRDATLTLTTCWPVRYVGPAPKRLIVTAKPLDVAPLRDQAARRIALE